MIPVLKKRPVVGGDHHLQGLHLCHLGEVHGQKSEKSIKYFEVLIC